MTHLVSRSCTTKVLTPYFLPSMTSWAKTAQWVAVEAAPPIHHLVAYRCGVWMMNSSLCGSNVAVVSIPATLEPWAS
jgi:hypothetical protein